MDANSSSIRANGSNQTDSCRRADVAAPTEERATQAAVWGARSAARLRLSIVAADGSVRWQGEGAGEVVLAWRGAYDPGDSLVLEANTTSDLWLVVKLDACLERSVVLLRGGRFVFPIPFGDERKPYGKGWAFGGERHGGFVRVADPREVGSWRNLALNAMDRKLAACEPEAGSVPVLYPHASTNVVCDNPQFSPHNAIDGVISPGRHGSWPHGSWGVNGRDDAWLRVDFGVPVVADELRLYLRADFPHDSCWREATVEFSDGGRQRLELVKAGARQSFALGGREIEWLRLCGLQRREEPGFCALSQLEVWGQVKMAQNSGGVVHHSPGAVHRVMILTDTANEADDQYALAHALLSPSLDVRGVVAQHFGASGSTRASYDEAARVMDLIDSADEVPLLMGASGPVDSPSFDEGQGAEAIVREALRDDDSPLYLLCIGPLTDVALALRLDPGIAQRLVVVWVGGGRYPNGSHEANCARDIVAAQEVFRSRVPLWQIPSEAYKMLAVSAAEIEARVRPHGALGAYLAEELEDFRARNLGVKKWVLPESWVLGDQAAVGVLLAEQKGCFEVRPAPALLDDCTYGMPPDPTRTIRVYHSLDTRLILEDLFCKLALRAR